jgi:hypothetical protein
VTRGRDAPHRERAAAGDADLQHRDGAVPESLEVPLVDIEVADGLIHELVAVVQKVLVQEAIRRHAHTSHRGFPE